MERTNGERLAEAIKPVLDIYREKDDEESKHIVVILERLCSDQVYFACVVSAVAELAKTDRKFLIHLLEQMILRG